MQSSAKRVAIAVGSGLLILICVTIANRFSESAHPLGASKVQKSSSTGDRPDGTQVTEIQPIGKRESRPDQNREIAACLASLTGLLESSERERIADRAKGVREIQLTPELRKAYLAPADTVTVNVRIESLVANRPTDAERDNAIRAIDKELSALQFLDVAAKEELKQQLIKKYFNYKKSSKIIRKQTYADNLGIEHHSIVSYDTDQVMEWDGEDGLVLSPEDASDIEVMKGGRESYISRYSHLFK